MKRLSTILLLFFLLSAVHGSTYVVPNELPVNDTVYVIYQWEPSVNIHNFSLNIYSDGVQFENNSINISYIGEGQKILQIFEGKVNESGDQSIIVSTAYTLNNSSINSVEFFQIKAIPKTDVKTVEKVAAKNNTIVLNNSETQNTSKETDETNVSYNLETKNETKNISEKLGDSSTDTVLLKTDVKDDMKKETITLNDICHIVSGLIVGILLGMIIMYLHES